MNKLLLSIAICLLLNIACQSTNNQPKLIYDLATDKNLLEQEYQKKLAEDPQNINYRFTLAYTYYKNFKYLEAINELSIILNNDPFNAESHLLQGQISYILKDYSSAQQSFNTVVSLSPNLIAAHYGLAVIYLETADYPRAKKAVQSALLIDPLNFPSRVLNVNIKTEMEGSNYLELLRELDLLAKQKPDSSEILNLRIKIYSAQGQFGNAERAILNYSLLNEIDDNKKGQLCNIKIHLGKLGEVENLLESFNSDGMDQWLCHINLLVAKERYAAALDYFKQKQNNFFATTNLRITEAALYSYNFQYDRSLKLLQELYFDNEQNNHLLNYHLALIYWKLQNLDKANEHINIALKIKPNVISYKLLYTQILLKLYQVEKAEDYFYDSQFTLFDPYILEVQGDIYYTKKNMNQARRFYNAAQELLFRPSITAKLAIINFAEKSYNQAIQIIYDSLEKYPANHTLRITAAKFQYILGNYQECINLLQDEKQIENTMELSLYLGLCYVKNDDAEKGIKTLSEAAIIYNDNIKLIDELSYQLGLVGRYYEAISYLQLLLALKPIESSYLYPRLINLYTLVGDKDKEIETRWIYNSN